MNDAPRRTLPPRPLAYGVAGVTVWERPSGAVFWGLVALAVLFVVLFGVRVLLSKAAQQRREHEAAHKRRRE